MQLHETQLHMSTFAVENSGARRHMRCGSGTAPDHREIEMRIVETGVAGVVAIASQILIFATVLI
ncbi:MAG TPA: hypothetical protein VFP12_17630 [Allosphingosinicella sp.]|nr:hypothetical protein [Allosphingosinicella sp.]